MKIIKNTFKQTIVLHYFQLKNFKKYTSKKIIDNKYELFPILAHLS